MGLGLITSGDHQGEALGQNLQPADHVNIDVTTLITHISMNRTSVGT